MSLEDRVTSLENRLDALITALQRSVNITPVVQSSKNTTRKVATEPEKSVITVIPHKKNVRFLIPNVYVENEAVIDFINSFKAAYPDGLRDPTNIGVLFETSYRIDLSYFKKHTIPDYEKRMNILVVLHIDEITSSIPTEIFTEVFVFIVSTKNRLQITKDGRRGESNKKVWERLIRLLKSGSF